MEMKRLSRSRIIWGVASVVFLCVVLLSTTAFSLTNIAPPIQVKTIRDAYLYSKEVPVLRILQTGEQVRVLKRGDRWTKVRHTPHQGQSAEGLVRSNTLVKKGSLEEVLRRTQLYALARPVLVTIPKGAMLEIIAIGGKWYLARYTASKKKVLEGLIHAEVVQMTKELQEATKVATWTKEVKRREKAEAEARAKERAQERVQQPSTGMDQDAQELLRTGAVHSINVEFNEVRIDPVLWLGLSLKEKQGLVYWFSKYFDSKGSTGRVRILSSRNDQKLGTYSVWSGVKIYQ